MRKLLLLLVCGLFGCASPWEDGMQIMEVPAGTPGAIEGWDMDNDTNYWFILQ